MNRIRFAESRRAEISEGFSQSSDKWGVVKWRCVLYCPEKHRKRLGAFAAGKIQFV